MEFLIMTLGDGDGIVWVLITTSYLCFVSDLVYICENDDDFIAIFLMFPEKKVLRVTQNHTNQ